MIQKKFDKLKGRKQSPDESIISYIDDVTTVCREIDPTMSDLIIIQYLMSGLQPDLRKELSRRQSTLTSLTEFIKYAKIEQDIYDTFEKSCQLSLESQQVQFNRTTISPLTAAIKRPNEQYHPVNRDDRNPRSLPNRSSVVQRNSFHQMHNQTTRTPGNYARQYTFNNKSTNNQSTSYPQFNQCKVCGRNNHRTIDCFYKQSTGCFNCGRSHLVRECTMPPHFQ
jgi:hypothetical protein